MSHARIAVLQGVVLVILAMAAIYELALFAYELSLSRLVQGLATISIGIPVFYVAVRNLQNKRPPPPWNRSGRLLAGVAMYPIVLFVIVLSLVTALQNPPKFLENQRQYDSSVAWSFAMVPLLTATALIQYGLYAVARRQPRTPPNDDY